MDLTSLLIGFTGGLMTFYTFHRKIQIENILKERTKWREQVRKLSRDIVYKASKENKCKSSLEADIAELEIRLNPLDGYDKDIIDTAKKCAELEKRAVREKFAFRGKFAFRVKFANREKYAVRGKCADPEKTRQDFIFKVSKLLKADWERAKFETSLFAFLYKFDDKEIRKFRGFYNGKK